MNLDVIKKKKYKLKDLTTDININYSLFFKNKKKFEINYCNSYMSIDSIFKKYKIKNCIINFGQGILSSFNACILNDYCKNNKVNIFFPMTNSPLNGRFMIYDDIYPIVRI